MGVRTRKARGHSGSGFVTGEAQYEGAQNGKEVSGGGGAKVALVQSFRSEAETVDRVGVLEDAVEKQCFVVGAFFAEFLFRNPVMTVVAGDDALDSIVDIPTVRGRVFPVVGCGAVSVSYVEIVVVTARVVKDGAERECVEIVGRDFELAPEKECKEENALDVFGRVADAFGVREGELALKKKRCQRSKRTRSGSSSDKREERARSNSVGSMKSCGIFAKK